MIDDDLFAGPDDDSGGSARSRKWSAAASHEDGSPDSAGQNLVDPAAPLAERMRPLTLDEIVGQPGALGPGTPLRRMVESDTLRSFILWGPPGCGKTTLAAVVARATRARFVAVSAVTSGIKEAKALMEEARAALARRGRRTVLFVDEIHRFNKAQQDAFLPFVEEGAIVLIGATTENPSFSLVSALLSRCAVFTLSGLPPADLESLMRKALYDGERGLGGLDVAVPDEILARLAELADGDARRALNLLELAVANAPAGPDGRAAVTAESLGQALNRQTLLYDKSGEEHYNLISAMHKAMRGSDVQASVYWTARMLASGEDPLYVARRMIRFASEDIGNADPQALRVALDCRQAYETLGSPEGELALIQCAVYLAAAPKSVASYRAWKAARVEIEATGSLSTPLHIRNAPTGLMKGLGYGAGYQYDPDVEGGVSNQTFLPDALAGREFYKPGPHGFDREISKRMDWYAARREEARQPQ